MTVIGLVHCNLCHVKSFSLQGIQYGYSLGSFGCQCGLIVNLQSLHESSRLKAVAMALIAAVPATGSIVCIEGDVATVVKGIFGLPLHKVGSTHGCAASESSDLI
jgi:hypothetical protein